MTNESEERLETRNAIAVVGMAGRFPGARNTTELWRNLRDGIESVRAFTPEELHNSNVGAEALANPSYVNAGAPLDDADCFDAAFFGCTPREAELMDPQHRVFLECALSALQDAGYDPGQHDGLIGVFGGVARNTYFMRNAEVYRALLDEGALYEAILGSEKDFPVTRVAYKLNLKGPSVTVQSACSTSGVAMHLACQSLIGGECDMALAGGTRVRVPLHAGYIHLEGGIPSPDGHCRAFDAGAKGCVFGSGVGVVVLKRLADAIGDRDHIDAVILGTAINNDGTSKVGFTAPSVQGQSAVIQEALALADVDADTIDYVEAHGTGTSLGDPIEIAALADAFRKSTDRCGYCAIGSVKTNIGHLDAGSGVTGLIKTVLALRHGQMPPSLNFETPNPQIDFANSPFFVNDELREWTRNGRPRRAGISSFGLGGTNFHAILEEAPPVETSGPSRPWQLLTLSAKSSEALEAATHDLTAHMHQAADSDLADTAYTLGVGRQSFEYRRIAVCRGAQDAALVLEGSEARRLLTGRAQVSDPSVVFMFSGQGSQHVNMGRELYETESAFRQVVDSCATILHTDLELDLRTLLYPNAQQLEAAQQELLQTGITQPALFVIEYALAQLWREWGVEPEAMIGHSVGEYVAACLAGVFSLEDALHLVAVRGRLMQQQPPGAMLAVRASVDAIQEFCSEGISLAASNAPSLSVLSGPSNKIESLAERFAAENVDARVLHTSHAFHSEMMEPALEPFANEVRAVTRNAPTIRFISSVTGTWITLQDATDPNYWSRQIREPVLFSQGICQLQETPGRILLEVGPGTTMSTLARQHANKQAQQTVVSSLSHPKKQRSDLESMMQALGRQWVAGLEIDWSKIYANERRYRVPLPTYPFERKRHWLKSVAAPANLNTDSDSAESLETSHETDDAVAGGTRKDRVLSKLQQLLHDLSGVAREDLSEHATFLEMGFDSLFLTRATVAFQKEFRVKITFRQLFEDAPTLDTLSEFIDRQLPDEESISEPQRQTVSPPKKRAVGDDTDQKQVKGHGPWKPANNDSSFGISPRQRRHLDGLIERYTSRTRASKELTQAQRTHLADPRAVTGFNKLWKEMVYQISVSRSSGSRIWDIDGNEYVDLVMGFGINLFGYSPPFVRTAVEQQLVDGVAMGVLTPQACKLADLLCEIVGLDRVNFVNTGSEAVSAAVRAARTVTGRDRIAVFEGDYHGIFDELLVRGIEVDGQRRSVPVAPGIPDFLVENVLVLEYEDPDLICKIKEHAHELAGIIVEPVPASRPGFPLKEAIHALRHVCTQCDIALIFDELITAFRISQRGAQGYYGVDADLVGYGKVLSGGLPLAAVGGKTRFMDAFDGGMWQFGDDSFPEEAVTFFGGTFVRHPLSVAAALANLQVIQKAGPQLQEDLNRRTSTLVKRLDAIIQRTGVPLRVECGGSMLLLKATDNNPLSRLIFFHMREKGVHMTERVGFLSTAHSDADLDFIVNAFEESIREMQDGECFAGDTTQRVSLPLPVSKPPRYNGMPILDIEQDGIPLTAPQQEIWLSASMSREQNASYNLSTVLDIEGDLNVEKMRLTVQKLVDRHESLRSTISPDGERQYIAPHRKLETPLLDLSSDGTIEQNRRLAELRMHEVDQAFDLVDGPLYRSQVVRLTPDHHLIVFTVHHIICDGYSWGILLRDLGALYTAEVEGGPDLRPPARWTEHVIAQHDEAQRADREAAESYWLEQFVDGVPVLELPTDRPRPASKTYNATRLGMRLQQVADQDLNRLCAKSECTLFTIIFAAYSVLLHRLSGQNNVVVGIAAAGQAMSGEDDLVGHCVNLLPLQARLDGKQSFAEYVRDIRVCVLDAFEHQNYTFGSLIQKLRVERDSSRLPLVSVIFNMDSSLEDVTFSGLRVQAEFIPRKYENFDIFFNFRQGCDGIQLECTYNTDLFDEDTMRRRLQEFDTLLAAIIANPQKPIDELPLLPEEELQLLAKWNDTRHVYPPTLSVQSAFESQVERAPNAIAVVGEEQELTYADLNRRANQLAHHLRSLGVERETVVGVCMGRTVDMVTALLGTLKAGAAYVPLDPTYPQQRLAFMLDDSRAQVLLTERRLSDALPDHSSQVVWIDSDWSTIAQNSGENPAGPTTDSTDLAYLIYTSGSTGLPKGVAIEHGSALSLIHWAQDVFSPDELAGVLCSTSICFDLSVFELFVPLSAGGSAILAENAMHLRTLRTADRVTLINTVPSAMAELLRAGNLPESVRTVNLVGEPLTTRLVQAIYDQPSVRKVYDLFGPSEDTTYSTFALRSAEGPDTIGKPIANTEVHLLDALGQPVPIGVPGEMYLGGAGLARGYFRRPELTAERFVQKPRNSTDNSRLYRTGDLARWMPDGNLEFLGRIDHQVKIRGFRIELGEIESAIDKSPAVADSVVLVREDVPDDERLVAYLVPTNGAVPSVAEMREQLRHTLPDYMIPQHIVQLNQLPRTPNGKVDRRALPAPNASNDRIDIVDKGSCEHIQALVHARMDDLMRHERDLEQAHSVRRIASCPGLERSLNELCCAYVCQYLHRSKVEFQRGASISLAKIVEGLDALPSLERHVDYLLELVCEDGFLVRHGDSVRVLRDLDDAPDPDSMHESLLAQHPEFSGLIEMLRHCVQQYPEALSGQIPAIAVLYPDGTRTFLDRKLFEETVTHKNIKTYERLARYLALAAAEDLPLKVLEIGAGTGMLTWQIAPELKGRNVEYHFTDLATTAVQDARQEACKRQLDQMRFAVLDISQDPEKQGLRERDFDLILGLNVVHATQDLDVTLGNLKKLLRPHGAVCLIEYLSTPRWDNMIWGLAEGWWYFDDAYRRTSPLVDLDTWRQAFRKQGFRDVSTFPADRNLLEQTDAGLIIASAEPAALDAGRPSTYVAPRDGVESMLVNLWRATLGVSEIGIKDNFFDLGGHSLLAVRMIIGIEKEYSRRLPFAAVLQAPTIEELANIVRQESWTPPVSNIDPVQPHGSKPPFFFASGTRNHFGARLGKDQPVYRLLIQDMDQEQHFWRVKDMAAYCIEKMRMIQREGPYFLGGHCFGGVVAYEMAQQLQAQGQSVAMLALFDSGAPGLRDSLPRMSLIEQLWRRTTFQVASASRFGMKAQFARFQKRVRKRSRQMLWRLLWKAGSSTRRLESLVNDPRAANYKAAREYVPRRYQGPITLFRPTERVPWMLHDPHNGWDRLTDEGVDVYEIPGNHSTIYQEPNVSILIENLAICLEAAQQTVETVNTHLPARGEALAVS